MPVSPVNHMISIIRQQCSAKALLPLRKPAYATRNVMDAAQANEAAKLELLIKQRVKEIDVNDPKRGRKAFRIFLESVLFLTFGEGLLSNPNFAQLVDNIQNAMEFNEDTAPLVQAAVDELLPR